MDNFEFKKHSKVNIRPITSLLIGLTFLSIIFLSIMLGSPKKGKPAMKSGNHEVKTDEQGKDSFLAYDGEMLAVVIGMDVSKQEITVFNIDTKEILTLNFTGASNITDKYGQIIVASHIPIGSMVDIGYIKDTLKLMKMQESTEVWEYIGVSNLSINHDKKIMKIGSKTYRYPGDLIVLDGKDRISADDLKEQDVLTIRGFEETVWSIVVEKGHGTVTLVDTDGFQGGNVTVGYEAMQEITENMTITVREGNFNLIVENGKYSVTKNIDIVRNEETVVSLKGLGQLPEEVGQVTFQISPFGADLFIDGKLTSYANPIELSYGNHDITVSLGGYTTYAGSLRVKEANQTVSVALPEASSKKKPDFTVISDSDIPDGIPNHLEIGEQEDTRDNEEDVTVDEDHYIYVQNPVEASVYLNGEYMGTSPVGFEKIIGTHVITFIRDGYEVKSYTIEVEDDGLNTYLNMPDLVPLE